VVGVSWEQANAYCRWRTDRANEKALIANGLIDAKNPYLGKSQIDFDRADSIRKNLTLKKQNKNLGEYVLIPDFRLPTEAEWEYAAKLSLQKSSPNDKASKSGQNATSKGILDPQNSPYPWASSGNENIRYT
ncbi:MAG: SUMF1/EgtB/PvdO family nonheme iron enzyme, partial [Chitinophagaceae bacterium]